METEVKEKKPSYFRQVQQELKKISWTSKDELILSTKIVIMSTFLFALGIYVADISVRSAFSMISNLVRLITG
jgi:preprotein translocase subunit SecE